ncbi:MAG TPA: YceI family protein [Cyclobacteriaceae bacterium]|nr:YceI family protein [Cyclobacteriaceae bacterium]HMV08503.1 YceI family protein [Cyclobacteriaceae bacterium]HMV89214.1 YceI family protein [Cyclobacteriaceae bacterium]HMX01276.1 YceI family protein [Cyclobacteriaceae bacterium]HMX51310.1 YceI family protein [Cyclobacteriaceae bacterium]
MNRSTKTGLLLTIAMFAVSASLYAQEYIVKTSKSTIQGTSTLHDWESEISQLTCKTRLVVENNVLKKIQSAEVTIPVAGIKSAHGKTMDNKTYDAFLYEKNPNITFLLIAAHVTQLEPGKASFEASGYLEMAGTSKSVKLSGMANMLPNGDIQFTMSKKINMTEFKMTQPTAVMGTITVGAEVTVNFDFTMTPSPDNQQAKQ